MVLKRLDEVDKKNIQYYMLKFFDLEIGFMTSEKNQNDTIWIIEEK